MSTGLFKLTSITTSAALAQRYPTSGSIRYELNPELEAWFADQGWVMGKDWRWQWTSDPVFYFTDGNKAMIFKLAWGGQ